MYKYLLQMFSFLIVACSPLTAMSSSTDLLETLKKEFVQQVSAGANDVKVSEITDKADDKKAFLKKSLPGLYIQGNEKVTYKEIFVRQGKQSGHFHLGMIKLEYGNKQKARAAMEKIKQGAKSSYFSNTKILTKYLLLVKDNAMLVIYSETFIDPVVRNFFKKTKQKQ